MILVGTAQVDARVRDWVVCPRCRGELGDQLDALVCAPCKLQFRVVEGVPWLAEDLASPWSPPADGAAAR